MNINCKVNSSIGAVALIMVLAACGDDNGSGADVPEKQEVVVSVNDLGTCNNEFEGDTVFVKEKRADYICMDGEWTPIADLEESSSSKAKSSSSKKIESCSSNEKTPSSSSKEKKDSSSSGVSSSEKIKSSSSIATKTAWRYLNPKISYGEIVDSRDGQKYKTTKVNGLQEWFAENLNYADSVKTPSLLGHSWCYENSADSCAKYGRLYTWAAAIDSAKLEKEGVLCGNGLKCELPEKIQGICPEGWRFPSEDDWTWLLSSVSKKISGQYVGVPLRAVSGWSDEEGSDIVGFSALPAGARVDSADGMYLEIGSQAFFWGYEYSAKEEDRGDGVKIFPYETDGYGNYWASSTGPRKRDGVSVRCVRDVKPVVELDSLLDERDGQVYKTVKIGTQVWMAENLNYADSVLTPSLVKKSWCYGKSLDSCAKYGRLYSWAAAIDSVALTENGLTCGYGEECDLPEKIQGICPEGWHLPSSSEFITLINYAGGLLSVTSLISKEGWDEMSGTDDFGFSALPGGGVGGLDEYAVSERYFKNSGKIGSFWTSSYFTDDYGTSTYYVYAVVFQKIRSARYLPRDAVEANSARSVRCIKD